MRDVAIVGVGMTHFGKFLERGLKDLAREPLAGLYVASGIHDVPLALGREKLSHEDKQRSFQAIGAAVDVEAMRHLMEMLAASAPKRERGDGGAGAGQKRSMFIALYAMAARPPMAPPG